MPEVPPPYVRKDLWHCRRRYRLLIQTLADFGTFIPIGSVPTDSRCLCLEVGHSCIPTIDTSGVRTRPYSCR